MGRRRRDYDAEATISQDGSRIVVTSTRDGDLEMYTMGVDSGNVRRLTHNGAANFAPYFHPDGRRIIFASSTRDPISRDFDLCLIGVDGSGLERVTTHMDFDGFPMFSCDGRRLVLESNRRGVLPGETNIFLADWIEHPGRGQ